MRRFSALVILISGCSGATPEVRAAKPSASLASLASPAPPAPKPARPINTTGLASESLLGPVSPATVRFVTPRPGDRIALADARSYDVRWLSERLDPDGLGVDVALDAQRPRRLPGSGSESRIPLGLLLPPGEAPTAGEHWLFAAPIAASGLVPRRAEGAAPAAVAVRFLIGDAPASSPTVGGAIWLRKPEGTYNGPRSERVLFDAQAFAGDGTPIATPCAIQVRGKRQGELAFPGPFSVLVLESGEYEISASAPGAEPAPARRFSVNSELGRTK